MLMSVLFTTFMTHDIRNVAYHIKAQKHFMIQKLMFLIKATAILIFK